MNGISWTGKLFPDIHLAGFKRKLDRHLRDKRGYISFSFLPLYRQLDDLDSLTHQVQVQVHGAIFANENYVTDDVTERIFN